MSDDRTYLVTGANRGIGYAAAEALAQRGGRVILACRDLAAGEDAEEEIRRATGNREMYVVELDLAAADAVREAAADVRDRFDRIDVLVNNAGVFTYEKSQNADGLELQFAINHLGHFLFTNLLRPVLGERVVTVSSAAHLRGRIDLAAIETGGAEPWDPYQAYADSKLANVLFAFELARRLQGTGITSNAVHPGTVNTQMYVDYLKDPPPGLGAARSPEEGAEPLVYAATAPELDGTTGRYFHLMREVEASETARDVALARRLWDWSLKQTGSQESDWEG